MEYVLMSTPSAWANASESILKSIWETNFSTAIISHRSLRTAFSTTDFSTKLYATPTKCSTFEINTDTSFQEKKIKQ